MGLKYFNFILATLIALTKLIMTEMIFTCLQNQPKQMNATTGKFVLLRLVYLSSHHLRNCIDYTFKWYTARVLLR